MKQQILFIIWLLPVTMWAQKSPPIIPAQPVDTAHSLINTLNNPVLLQLATETVLYRELNDTLASRPAMHLRPGDTVIIREEYPNWIKVVRGTRDCINFSSDKSIYYMPKSGTHKARTYVLL